jgi:leishmanolysin-like peptidase
MQISQGKRCHVGLCLTAALVSAVLMTGAAGSEGVGGMRIVPHYHSSVQSLTAEQAALLKDVLLEPTLSWFGGVLKVQRELSPLVFERSCSETHRYVDRRRYCVGTCSNSTLCGPTPIPEQHLQPCRSCQRTNCSEADSSQPWQVGVPAADLVVYVSVVSDSYKCRYQQSVYSGHCQQEKRLDRPTGAYLAVCPTFLTTSPDFYHLQIASIVRHLVRILAFSESLFPFFRDEEGAPRNERDREGFPLRRPDGRYASDGVVRYYHHATWKVATTNETLIQPHFVKMIVTPNVVREVQSHFGCGEMIGGELESQTVLQSAAGDSFWEKRVFGEEVMTASASYYPVLSRLTLALLHDSG